MTLTTAEFIRRFLIHVLPHGFNRIRHYGLLASGTRAGNIARARRMLDMSAARPEAADTNCAEAAKPEPLSHPCPGCGGRMIVTTSPAVSSLGGLRMPARVCAAPPS